MATLNIEVFPLSRSDGFTLNLKGTKKNHEIAFFAKVTLSTLGRQASFILPPKETGFKNV